jgi:hypothetical protein
MFPLARDLAVNAFPVTVTCRALGFSTQAHHRWLAAGRASGTGTMHIR